MFISLIVMVALSIAAIALVRSVDTTTTIIGNLGFRLASIQPANLAVEKAAAALFVDADPAHAVHIANRYLDYGPENYYASRQVGNEDLARGVPHQLLSKSNFTLGNVIVDDTAGGQATEIRYVIERMCIGPGPATNGNCDLVPPKQPTGDTIGEAGLGGASIPFYRVTVRVDGPQNTTSFLQAMLR
jgi:type IV pilus assembly protein PilX